MRLIRLCLAIAAALTAGNIDAAPVQGTHIRTELVAENATLSNDGPQWVALHLTPEAGWHVYWRNPGDSGLPTKIQWTLPEGAQAGDIQWPAPSRLPLGDLVNYGYDGDSALLVPLTLPPKWLAGKPFKLGADARWLVCKDICIPGNAHYDLTLPVATASQADAANAKLFADTRAQLPQPLPADAQAHFAAQAGDFSLQIDHLALPPDAKLELFVASTDLIDYAAPQRIARDEGAVRISIKPSATFAKAPDSVDAVLVARSGDKRIAYAIAATPGPVNAVPAAAAPATPVAAPAPAPAPTQPLWLVLLSALAGGLILNLMPCVFPVLSLKAMALAHAGAQEAGERRRDALAYATGVMATFVVVAAILIGLRSTGRAFGWGFQLQSPAFVGFLAYLMFALGLSMSGVFAIGTRWMGVGQSLTELGGLRGSFATGVLAVVVASPCSAPYMGAAIGYALAQPSVIALSVFAALGLGLALPFLFIGLVPHADRFLPKPGAWMDTFKQILAFPLYLTSAGLLWVLARQTGADGIGIALVGLVLIGFAVWLAEHSQRTHSRLIALAAAIGALALLHSPSLREPVPGSTAPLGRTSGTTAIEAFSEPRLAELRAQHRTVFVNFTADWCISCKVNERVALDSSRVRGAFADRKVVWLEGDWTRYDPAITQVLERFGRSGVPLYLIYRDGEEPQVLPQVLTPDLVIDALGKPG